MPLQGAPTVADEFKAIPRDIKNSLATRIEQKRELSRPQNPNDLNPRVPDWLASSKPQVSIPSQSRPELQRLTDQLSSVRQLGASANEATSSAIDWRRQAAAARAIAQQKALSERQTELMNAIGSMDWGFDDFGTIGTGKRADVIAAAKRLLGMPYSWGGGHGSKPGPSYGIGRGAGTYGVDCSGLVRYAFAKAGISKWGRNAVSQTQSLYGRAAPISKLLPGDLVVKGGRGTATHIAIYLGGGKIIEAQRTGTRVHIRSIKGESGWLGIALNY